MQAVREPEQYCPICGEWVGVEDDAEAWIGHRCSEQELDAIDAAHDRAKEHL